MICKKCHKELSDSFSFCPYCGYNLKKPPHKKNKSGNGTGSAFQRPGQKTWTAQAVIGYRDLPPFDPDNPDNQKQRIPIKRTKGGFKTRLEALAYIPTLKANGILKPLSCPDLTYYWKSYESNDLEKLSSSKQTAYKIAWNKISKLHHTPLDQITISDLRNIVSSACNTYYTAKDCRTILTALYKMAAADGYANKDLPSFITLPSLTEKEREAFNSDEQKALWTLYESGDLTAAIPLLMIYTGLMPGEAFDLKIDQIDISKQMITGAGKKTKIRKESPVIIPTNLIPLINDLITHARPSGRIFGSSEDKWRNEYYHALEKAGCRKLQPYSCRHTTATALAIDKNIAPQTIKKIMRWSTTKMLDRYAHPDTKDLQNAIDKIVGNNDGNNDDNSKSHVGNNSVTEHKSPPEYAPENL